MAVSTGPRRGLGSEVPFIVTQNAKNAPNNVDSIKQTAQYATIKGNEAKIRISKKLISTCHVTIMTCTKHNKKRSVLKEKVLKVKKNGCKVSFCLPNRQKEANSQIWQRLS